MRFSFLRRRLYIFPKDRIREHGMATFVVAHGAWSAGWAWRKMRPLLRGAGHELWTPTYTGLGERAHLTTPDISLDTHIADVIAAIEMENLNDVILIGHSYGGMVATGVADRARARVAQLVYLDAFAPTDGQAVFDLIPPDVGDKMIAGAVSSPSGYGIPANPMPSDTLPEDVEWATPRRMPQPLKAFSTKIRLGGEITVPRTYIYCTKVGIGDTFGQFLARAKREGWNTYELDASHNPHITTPAALLALLNAIAAQ
jgi:pimeloyl-ACP methyl ester carboxylesterase